MWLSKKKSDAPVESVVDPENTTHGHLRERIHEIQVEIVEEIPLRARNFFLHGLFFEAFDVLDNPPAHIPFKFDISEALSGLSDNEAVEVLRHAIRILDSETERLARVKSDLIKAVARSRTESAWSVFRQIGEQCFDLHLNEACTAAQEFEDCMLRHFDLDMPYMIGREFGLSAQQTLEFCHKYDAVEALEVNLTAFTRPLTDAEKAEMEIGGPDPRGYEVDRQRAAELETLIYSYKLASSGRTL